MKKFLRWLLAVFLGGILCVVGFLIVVTVFAIPVELTRFKQPLEDMGTKWLGRPVRIEGPIVVATSLKPSFSLKGLRIQNPPDFVQQDFLQMEEVRLQLSILPLLQKKVHIPEFKVHGLAVTLEENQQEEVNWIFSAENGEESTKGKETTKTNKKSVPPGTSENSKTAGAGKHLENDSLVLEQLDLQEISVAYYSKGATEPARFLLSHCDGTMVAGQPMRLDIEGKTGEFAYEVDVSLASLEEFLTENRTWVELNLEIAKTTFNFSGNLDLKTATQSLNLAASVGGENLSDLGALLRLDLPPLTPYSLTTKLSLRENVAELQEVKVETGESRLLGTALIEKEGEDVVADIKLHSPLIQIDDFVFDDWSLEAESPDSATSEQAEGDNEKEGEQVVAEKEGEPQKRNLLDPEWLQKFDCSLAVVADKVESGNDFLGSGELVVTLKDGRIELAPLDVKLPAGGINIRASLRPGAENSEGALKVLIENFDIGILVRRSEPDSEMGGIVNLDVDLHSTAATIPELMRSGNGYFDFSGNLSNFKAGIIDLWAVNLISAVLSSTKENESQINCAVGRWSVEDGYLTSDAFFVDTSKIRICAEGNVNFKKERLKIKVSPKAKKAEFFSLATPVKLQGSFSDLHVKLGKGAVFGSVVKMIVSPVTTPLKRMFNDKIPSDGSDVCTMELGPKGHKEIVVPGCN